MTGRQHTIRTAERLTGAGAGVYGTSYSSWWWYYHPEEVLVS
jgi:hypothetical protein